MENQRKADLGDGYYLNPILGGDFPDPSVLRAGNEFYMTHSSFTYGPGLLIWHSGDLVNWEPAGYANAGYEGNIWAPEFIKHGGLYYIYYYADGSNWVIVAPSPQGAWSKPVKLEIGYIDPGHFVDVDGERYLHMAGGYAIKLTRDGTALQGDKIYIHDGWEIPGDWVVESGGGKCGYEGPKITFKNGYYYLTAAQGGTAGPATSHMITSFRSATPFGPWEISPFNPIIHTKSREDTWWSRGHGTLVDMPDGSWWVMYHAYEKGYHTLGRQTLLEPVEWTADGWFRVPEGIELDKPIKKPSGKAVAHGMPLSDGFPTGPLGLQWRFYEEYDTNRYIIDNGCLDMAAKGSSPKDCSPMLCIPVDHSYEALVHVTISNGTKGGLILYYNPSCYCGAELSGNEVLSINAVYGVAGRNEYDKNEAYLRLVNDRNQVSLYYGTDGRNWKKTETSFDTTGYQHNNFGGFTSLRLGLYATGKGNVRFSGFRYRALDM